MDTTPNSPAHTPGTEPQDHETPAAPPALETETSSACPTPHTEKDISLGMPITREDVPSLVQWGRISTPQGEMGYEIHWDGTVRTHVPDDGSLGWDPDPSLTQGAAPENMLRHFLLRNTGSRDEGTEYVPPTVRALIAQQAVLQGDQQHLEDYRAQVLGLKPSWDDAVSTALVGDWAQPLRNQGELGAESLGALANDIRTTHRQLLPLWERRTYGGHRVLLLEKPSVENATLRDLVVGRLGTDTTTLISPPDDPRLAAILAALQPDEREVMLARGLPGVTTWADAAAFAGAAAPEAFGEHVRRKVRRLAAEHERRTTQKVIGGHHARGQQGGAA